MRDQPSLQQQHERRASDVAEYAKKMREIVAEERSGRCQLRSIWSKLGETNAELFNSATVYAARHRYLVSDGDDWWRLGPED